MNAVAELNLEQNNRRAARGRKDSEGQKQVIETDELRTRLPELERLLRDKNDASEAFGEAVKAAAEVSGYLAASVRKFVAASVGDKVGEKRREAEQLALIFEELA